LDAVGTRITGIPLTFTTIDPEISVSSTGLVTSEGPTGQFSAIVTAGAVTATIRVVVPTQPAAVIASSQSVFPSPLGIAISPSGVAYLTIPATGAPALYRLNLPSFVFAPPVLGSPPGSPLDVAFSGDGTLAYAPALSPGKLAIIKVASNQVVASVGSLPDNLNAVAVSNDDSTVYVAGANDTLYVIDATARALKAKVNMMHVATALRMDPTGTRLYASSANGHALIEVDASNYTVLRTLPVGGQPQGLDISPDGSELYVADELGRLVIWDLATNAIKDSVPLTGGPFGLALTPDKTQIYVALSEGLKGSVAVFDRLSRALITTIHTDGSPRRIAFDITGLMALVTNDASMVHLVQ
jgi:sugar lactone lactonase YvrE